MNWLRLSNGLLILMCSAVSLSSEKAAEYQLLFDQDKLLNAPFHGGEKLSYEINWKPLFAVPAFKAGDVTMSIEKSRLSGTDTYKISAWAISDGALTKVAGIKVRSYFESHIDRHDFRSYRMFQKIRQGSRNRDLLLTFDYENDQTLVRETDQSVTPPEELKNKVIRGIPGPAADLLSVFYVARLRTARPGDRFQLYLNEKGDFKKVLVVAEEAGELLTPVGRFRTIKLATTGGIFKNGGDFRIWYSTDSLRIPVKFEADVKVGKVYGSLIRVQTPRQARSVIRVD